MHQFGPAIELAHEMLTRPVASAAVRDHHSIASLIAARGGVPGV